MAFKITRQETDSARTYAKESNDVLYSSREEAWKVVMDKTFAKEVKIVEEFHKAIFSYRKLTVEECVVEVCPQEEEEIRLWGFLSEKFGVRRNFEWRYIHAEEEWDVETEKKALKKEGDLEQLSSCYDSWHQISDTIYLVLLMDRHYLVNVQDYIPRRSADKFTFQWCRLGDSTPPSDWRKEFCVIRAKYNGWG